MILAELEIDKIKALLDGFISKKRYSLTDGQNVYLSYSIHSRSITIFENLAEPYDPQDIKAFPIANIRYFESRDCWQVVFLNEDLEWHVYEPEQDPEVRSFEEALELIHEKVKARYV